MTTSNEPGYYEEGNFGIRIENVCITVRKDTPHNFSGREFCAFETVTVVPIQTSLVDTNLMTQSELLWLNSYNQRVNEVLTPLMELYFPEAVAYLHKQTAPIK
jgi:Xaa-Pro aminopeptidase